MTDFEMQQAEAHLHQNAKFMSPMKGKVKCTLVQALRPCTGHMAHRGSRGITLPFLDHGTRRV